VPRAGRPQRRRLSDAKLAALAREMEGLKERAKELTKRADRRKTAIIAELQDRGTTSLLHDGYKVTMVQNEVPQYDEEYLKEVLTPRQWKKVTKTVLDPSLLSVAVQQGDIDLEVVQQATTIRTTAPYLRCGDR
jgi:hypothetical protein